MTNPYIQVDGIRREMDHAEYEQYLIDVSDGAAQAAAATAAALAAQRAAALTQGAAMVARAQTAQGQRLMAAGRTAEGLALILKAQGVLP